MEIEIRAAFKCPSCGSNNVAHRDDLHADDVNSGLACFACGHIAKLLNGLGG